MPNTQASVYAGGSGPGNIPEILMKYDKDSAGALLYLKRGTTKLMHMLHTQFGKRNVTSFIPTWFDINELDNIFTVYIDQDVDTRDGFRSIVMTNDQAAQLQPGDILYTDTLFLSDGRNGGTAGTYNRLWGGAHFVEEQMLVIAEPENDSHSVGYSKVTVRRGYVNNSVTNMIQPEPDSAQYNSGQLKKSDKLMLGGNIQWTGSDAPRGKGKNIEADTNPLQIMRWSFEDQTETSMESTFLKESPLTINQKLALANMAYELEWRGFYNRKMIEKEGNRWRYAMGGMFDYLDDPTGWIDYSKGGSIVSLTWPDFQNGVMAPLFALGGSSTKVAYCSVEMYTALAQLLWNKVSITINEAWSKKFGFEIYSVMGGGGTLNFVPSWVYGRNDFRSRQMLVLDYSGPYFRVDVLEDLHINKGPNGAGLQLPGQRIKKFEYVTIMGMQRRAKQYHALITGLPDPGSV